MKKKEEQEKKDRCFIYTYNAFTFRALKPSLIYLIDEMNKHEKITGESISAFFIDQRSSLMNFFSNIYISMKYRKRYQNEILTFKENPMAFMVKTYVIAKGNINPARITSIKGSFKENLTVLEKYIPYYECITSAEGKPLKGYKKEKYIEVTQRKIDRSSVFF